MSVGTTTITALIAAALATLVWWVGAPAWLALLLFGVVLVLVVLAGPLVRLP